MDFHTRVLGNCIGLEDQFETQEGSPSMSRPDVPAPKHIFLRISRYGSESIISFQASVKTCANLHSFGSQL